MRAISPARIELAKTTLGLEASGVGLEIRRGLGSRCDRNELRIRENLRPRDPSPERRLSAAAT